MSIFQAIFLGFVQGITEFLPVSSSGHLAIFQALFGLKDTGLLFDVILHVGTLIAIFVAYWKDILKLIVEAAGIVADVFRNLVIFFKRLFSKDDLQYVHIVSTSYRKFVVLVIVATIPTAILGFLGKQYVESAAKILLFPGICLIATSVILFVADKFPDGDKLPRRTSYLDAFTVGTVQGIATLPGISRSGSTITACLALGLDKRFAVEYSFIMSIPAVLGAAILEVREGIETTVFSAPLIVNYIVGMLVAAVTGYICIKLMLLMVKKRKFLYFSIYCLVAGVVSIVTYFIKG